MSFDVPELLIPQLIAQHGRWQADKLAVVDGDRRATWGEFDAATNRIANGLATLGLARGSRLAVLMHNGLEMTEVLFGAGKAGVSVVPINLSVNDAAVAGMIDDCGAAAVAASAEQCARIDGLRRKNPGLQRLKLLGHGRSGADWIELTPWRDRHSSAPPAVQVSPDDECNIIYSSGTTALPKGIVHTHRCRVNWAVDMAVALRYHSGAVTVISLGQYSNISWVAMLSTVLCGGTLVIMPSFTPSALLEQIARHRVTHGAFVPVQLQRLLECGELGDYEIGSLEAIMCCGSPLPADVKRRSQQALDCALIELYGLTEGIVTTLAPEDFHRKLASVGKPIPGQQLRLIDEDGREVEPGAAGEIVGFGRLVMSGYHGRPDATREATWLDPHGRRWLRTGDIGRLDEEGFLYIVDRKKDMILSGAQNVYPADIEEVMRGHPEIAEVAVIGVPSEKWGETPFAVIVPRNGATPDAEALVEWTNARVGRQQRISGAAVRPSLPRNPNGKILKRELRIQYARQPERTT
jgi:acyl-CoA synthetase (AMP-forming)/AMP-acid ligase II